MSLLSALALLFTLYDGTNIFCQMRAQVLAVGEGRDSYVNYLKARTGYHYYGSTLGYFRLYWVLGSIQD